MNSTRFQSSVESHSAESFPDKRSHLRWNMFRTPPARLTTDAESTIPWPVYGYVAYGGCLIMMIIEAEAHQNRCRRRISANMQVFAVFTFLTYVAISKVHMVGRPKVLAG